MDVAKRLKEEWQVTMPRKEKVQIVVGYLVYLFTVLCIAVACAVLKDMLTDYINDRYITEKEEERPE